MRNILIFALLIVSACGSQPAPNPPAPNESYGIMGQQPPAPARERRQ